MLLLKLCCQFIKHPLVGQRAGRGVRGLGILGCDTGDTRGWAAGIGGWCQRGSKWQVEGEVVLMATDNMEEIQMKDSETGGVC